MECQSVRERLSGYLEGTATGEEERLIKEHLDSCGSCRSVLQDLVKTRDLLGSLEKVEPPAWMSQKIMDRVRQEADRRKGLIHRIFYPLHIKIPIEALAMVFIAVIAVYVYRAVPELKQAAVPLPAPPPATEGKFSRTDEKAPSSRRVEEPLAAKKKQAEAGSQQEEKKTAQMADRQALSPSPKAAREISRERGTTGLLATGREAQEPQESPAAPKMEKAAGRKAGPFAIRLSVHKNEAARKEIGEILRQLEARGIKDSAGGKEKTVTAELEGEKLNLFLQKLGEIGEIKEKDLPAEAPEGHIAIRIEIVTVP